MRSQLLNPRHAHTKRRCNLSHIRCQSVREHKCHRRLDYGDAQRVPLAPVRLAPVVLREPPPSFDESATVSETTVSRSHNDLNWSVSSAQRVKRVSSRKRRPPPLLQGLDPKPERKEVITYATHAEHDMEAMTAVHAAARSTSHRASLASYTTSGPFKETDRYGRSVPSLRSPSEERVRLKRKQSLPSIRTPYEGSADSFDQELVELQAIVAEQRRADAIGSQSSEQHVAAVAPTMRVDARSETLNDIGSALARPLLARDHVNCINIYDPNYRTQRRAMPRTASRASACVSGWLSNLLPIVSAPARRLMPKHIQNCGTEARPSRADSDTSLRISTAETGVSMLTPSDSPASRTHRRSPTVYEGLPSVSPASTTCSPTLPGETSDNDCEWRPRPLVRGEVGMAL